MLTFGAVNSLKLKEYEKTLIPEDNSIESIRVRERILSFVIYRYLEISNYKSTKADYFYPSH
jgi:hypothetical protein